MNWRLVCVPIMDVPVNPISSCPKRSLEHALGTVEGREKVAGLVSAIVSALPDLHNVEQDIIAERDIVAVRAVVEGTHKGDLLGIPASGRHVRWDAVDVYRVADGKIAEEWAADDLLAFVYGVGAYTPPWLSQQS